MGASFDQPVAANHSRTHLVRFVSWALLIGGSISLVVPSGYSLSPLLLFFCSAVLIWRRPGLNLTRDDWYLVTLMAGFFVVNVALNLVHGLSSRYYEGYSRFLLALPILLLLLAYPPRAGFWWAGVALGAVAGGIWAAWSKLAVDMPRVGGHMNPIQFGNLSLLSGSLCVAALGWANSRSRPRLWVALLLFGALGGLVGGLFSGARGGWLAVPVLAVLFYLHYRRSVRRRYLAVSLVILAVLSAGLYLTPQTGIQQRFGLALTELRSYWQEGHTQSSVGVRLAMWRGGLDMAAERPFLGWGETDYLRPLQERVSHPRTRRLIGQFDHLHNDLLDVQVKRGLLGALGVILIYLVPLSVFARRLQTGSQEHKSYALAGVTLVVATAMFGLTQAFLNHNSGVTVYAFTLVVLWALMRREERGSRET